MDLVRPKRVSYDFFEEVAFSFSRAFSTFFGGLDFFVAFCTTAFLASSRASHSSLRLHTTELAITTPHVSVLTAVTRLSLHFQFRLDLT